MYSEVQKTSAHPTRISIIEYLSQRNATFSEIQKHVDVMNHGRFGYHMRVLRASELIEHNLSTKKYYLTETGWVVAGLILILKGVTKRASLKELEQTFDAISDLVFIIDNDFRFIRVNKAMCDFLNMEPIELIGKRCFEVVHGTNKPWPNCPHTKTLTTRKAVTEEVHDPKWALPLLITVSPILGDNNEFVSSVHIAKDVSEQKISRRTLTCLYSISNLIKEHTSFEELLQEIVNRIPSAWQYPKITCARIMFNGQPYMTDNFRETIWKQEADIEAWEKKASVLEVYYLKETPELDEGPFLKEERNLINAIAEQIGRTLELNSAKKQLLKAKAS